MWILRLESLYMQLTTEMLSYRYWQRKACAGALGDEIDLEHCQIELLSNNKYYSIIFEKANFVQIAGLSRAQ